MAGSWLTRCPFAGRDEDEAGARTRTHAAAVAINLSSGCQLLIKVRPY